MRTHSRCPKCSGTRLYVCTNRQPGFHSSNLVHPFHVTTAEIPKKETGAQEGSSYRTHVGSYETWICAACGYTEWYARDPERLLERLAARHDGGVRVVDSALPGPYG